MVGGHGLADIDKPPLQVVESVPLSAYENGPNCIDGVHTKTGSSGDIPRSVQQGDWPDLSYSYESEIIEDIAPRVGVGVFWGAHSYGKSFAAMSLCKAIAMGEPIWGKETEQSAVAYCAFEAYGSILRRIEGIKQNGGPPDIPFRLINAKWLLSQDGHFADFERHLETVKADFELRGQRLGIVVIDTLINAFAGGDNDGTSDAGEAMRHLGDMAERLGCFILLIGHTGKDESRKIAGSFVWLARADASLQIRVTKDETDAILQRSVYVDKVKDGDMGFTISGFNLDVVEIGQKPNGKPLTTCVVEWFSPDQLTSFSANSAPNTDKPKVSPTDEAHMINVLNLVDNGNRNGMTKLEIEAALAKERRGAQKTLQGKNLE